MAVVMPTMGPLALLASPSTLQARDAPDLSSEMAVLVAVTLPEIPDMIVPTPLVAMPAVLKPSHAVTMACTRPGLSCTNAAMSLSTGTNTSRRMGVTALMTAAMAAQLAALIWAEMPPRAVAMEPRAPPSASKSMLLNTSEMLSRMLPNRSTVKSWKSAMDCDISGLIRVACEASPDMPTRKASAALAPKSCIAAPASTAFSRMASSAPTTAESSSTPPSCSPISPVKSPVDSSDIEPLSRSLTTSILSMTPPRNAGAAANAPPRMVSPTRPSAAPTLSIAPEKVSPAFSAEPPRVESIARWRSSKLICPLEARLVTSSAETPSSLLSAETAGIPLSPSCVRVSPITLPAFLALVKIEATSPKPLPAKEAVSATVPRTSASSLPGLMPAARNMALASAASEVANAVPFTAEPMSSMTCADSSAESLRPLNLA